MQISKILHKYNFKLTLIFSIFYSTLLLCLRQLDHNYNWHGQEDPPGYHLQNKGQDRNLITGMNSICIKATKFDRLYCDGSATILLKIS